MWEIITFSDALVINQVFNALGMIFGSGLYTSAGIVVSLAMVMGFGITSLSTGTKELPFFKWAIAALIFAMGFLTTTNVSVVSRTSGIANIIDNIPIAVAVPASVITQVGFHLTEMTETAFSMVNSERITVGGYLSPIKRIAEYRSMVSSEHCMEGAPGGNLNGYQACPSISNYARHCTAVKHGRQGGFWIGQADSALNVMEFDSVSYGTDLVQADGTLESLNCRDAWVKVEAMLSGPDFSAMVESNKSTIGQVGGPPLEVLIQESVDAITNSAEQGRKLSQAIYTLNPIIDGTTAFLRSTGNEAIAENFNTSIEMRNYGWAMQGSLFVQIVDKIIQIMEASVYSIAPFIGLMALTGAAGMKSVVMYMQILIILQVIPIMLVITQNILVSQAHEAYLALRVKGYDFGSYQFMLTLTREMEELAGLGGFFAATVVPSLALALVTGSTFALSSAFNAAGQPGKDNDYVGNRISQGSHVHDISAYTTTSGRNGTQFTENQAANLPVAAWQKGMANATQLSYEKMVSAEQNWQKMLSEKSGIAVLKSLDDAAILSLGSSVMSSDNKAAGEINSFINSMRTGQNLEDTTKKEMAIMMYAALEGKLDWHAVKAAVGAQASIQGSGSAAFSLSQALDGADGEQAYNELSKSFQEGRKADIANSRKEAVSESDILAHDKTLQKAQAEKEAAAKKYAEMSNISEGFSVQSTSDQKVMIQKLASDPEKMKLIREAYQSLDADDKQEVNDGLRVFSSRVGTMTDDQKLAASLINFIAENKDQANLAGFIATGDRTYLENQEAGYGNNNTLTPENLSQVKPKNGFFAFIHNQVNPNAIDEAVMEKTNNASNIQVDKNGNLVASGKLDEIYQQAKTTLEGNYKAYADAMQKHLENGSTAHQLLGKVFADFQKDSAGMTDIGKRTELMFGLIDKHFGTEEGKEALKEFSVTPAASVEGGDQMLAVFGNNPQETITYTQLNPKEHEMVFKVLNSSLTSITEGATDGIKNFGGGFFSKLGESAYDHSIFGMVDDVRENGLTKETFFKGLVAASPIGSVYMVIADMFRGDEGNTDNKK